jgi:hypothetical protein
MTAIVRESLHRHALTVAILTRLQVEIKGHVLSGAELRISLNFSGSAPT